MGVFNVSFLRPGGTKKGGSGYGILIDQLSIKENELAVDGNLSPGDYDVLIKMAQGFANSGALTADQRSNLTVKVSAYEKAKSASNIGDSNDIARLNREVEDENRNRNMMLGNNPQGFLKAQSDLLQVKAERLTESIEQIEMAGGDATAHWSEQAETLQQLQDTLDALDKVSASDGSAPIGDYVAYIDTNSRGEITKVKVGRVGDETGYAETNALYGGMQVYGKPNAKVGGEKVFRLGGVEYKGSSLNISDPDVPGSFRSAPLMSPTFTGNRNIGVIKEGWESVDTNSLRTQKYVRPGGFARGRDGILYEALENGSYRKYVNTVPDQLGLGEQDVLDLPSRMEQGFNSQSTETVDGMELPQMSMANPSDFAQLNAPSEAVPAAPGGGQPDAAAAPQASAAPAGRSRTPAPTERAPRRAEGIASRALSAARGFLGIG